MLWLISNNKPIVALVLFGARFGLQADNVRVLLAID
jgi:hypothetical protein